MEVMLEITTHLKFNIDLSGSRIFADLYNREKKAGKSAVIERRMLT